jgi:hypothetical protein
MSEYQYSEFQAVDRPLRRFGRARTTNSTIGWQNFESGTSVAWSND